MVMISERPAEVEDRAVPGHWEGDLIIGKDGRSAIGTLVERSTRYVMLGKVANQKAETVRDAIVAQITNAARTSPPLTDLGPRQRDGPTRSSSASTPASTSTSATRTHPGNAASNENTNGLLRQYFPKGTPLSGHSQHHLDAVADSLNNRPRQTLDWMKPSEKLAELLATTG